MYKILGGDGNEYGPVSADQIKQWVREGRANALTQVKPEGAAHWQPLSAFAELAENFGSTAAGAPPTIGALSPAGMAGAAGVHDGDYDLDIAGCLGRGFELFKRHMGLMIVVTLIAFAPQIIGGIVRLPSFIPLIGVIFSLLGFVISLVAIVVSGPLQGGLCFTFLKLGRGQPAEPGDAFAGFRNNFLHLFLAYFIRGLIIGACLIPFFVVLFVTVLLVIIQNPQHTPPPVSALIPSGITLLLTLPVVIWLSVNWTFTLALVADRNLDFWTAMKTSWRQVMRHWWMVFGLCVVVGLINFAGTMLCLVGLLFTKPVGMAAMLQAYETIFNPRPAQPGPRA